MPLAPTSTRTAALLLSGAGAPGELRARPLRGGVPRRRCWRVAPVAARVLRGGGGEDGGEGEDADAVAAPVEAAAAAAVEAAVAAFSAAWPRRLRLRSHDCRAHADALAAALTGVPDAMARDPRLLRRRAAAAAAAGER